MSNYTEKQRKCFNEFFSLIVKSFPSCLVSSTEMLNTQTALSKTDAEHLIDKLCEDKWLEKEKGKVSLGVRSLIELKEVLSSQLSVTQAELLDKDTAEPPKCFACKGLVVRAKSCKKCKEKKDCTYLHVYCEARLVSAENRNKICPKCKSAWN